MRSVAVSFPESTAYLKGPNVWVSGLPIRPEIGKISQIEGVARFGLSPEVDIYLIFGGSLGAERLNSLVCAAWPFVLSAKKPFQVLHVTGHRDFERIHQLYQTTQVPHKVIAYCHDMAHAYAAAKAVVCRAGASTVAELLACGRPALLVPYPYASNDHQFYNAQLVQTSGLGQVILEKDLTPKAIADFLVNAAPGAGGAATSKPSDAAARIAARLTSGFS